MKLLNAKQLILLSSCLLLLTACGNGEETDANIDDNQIEVPENQSSEGNDSDNTNTDEDETNNQSDDLDNEDENDDENEASSEDEVSEDQQGETESDTLANMTQEEREEHYRSLSNDPENLDEAVFEHLELRGLHENTVIYGGRVNPGSDVSIFGDGGHAVDVTVNEKGFFSLDLTNYDREEGDEFALTIAHDDMEERQSFVLPIHSSQDGMEVIESISDTSEWQEQVLDEVNEFPDIYPNALFYDHEAGRELDALLYSLADDGIINGYLVGLEEPNEEGEFLMNLLRYPEVGETITYYILADGVIASTERQVQEMTPEVEEAAEVIRNETDISLQTDTEEGQFQTVPNATIMITYPYGFIREESQSDESGEFSFEFPLRAEDMESGDSVFFTIKNENGFSDTIEVIVE